MNNPIIGVGTLNISRRAKELVLETLNNNRLSYGPFTQRFEADFARLHNCRFGIMSNSGTGALQIALQAMKELHGWADGDEVIVPAVTFVATANIVLHNRMQPVVVDVERDYYELDPNLLEAKITPRTRAVIPVHLFGQPADMDPIRDIARRYDLKIIEDSAETMFARYNGQPVGSLGDIGCFSTYVAHLLVTGVGGLNTTNNPEYAVRMRSLMNHGRDSIYISIDDDNDKSDEELRMIVARRFNFVSVGHSYRATEMEAALGLAQLDEREAIIAARRANAKLLISKLAHFDAHLQLPKIRPGSEHSFMMFPVVLRRHPKTELVNFLEQNGVETREMLPLVNQPVYQQLMGWCEDDYPVARWINQSGFYVGCHQDLTEFDLDYMAELFERHFRQRPASARIGACLLITMNGATLPAQTLEALPLELFDRIIILSDRPASEIEFLPDELEDVRRNQATQDLLATKIEILPFEGPDALSMLVNGRLQVEQEHLVLFTADGRHNLREVGRLLLALERGHDMVVASRFIVGGERRPPNQMNRYRSVGNRIFTLLANLLFYGNFSDCLSQLRAVKRSNLTKLHLKGAGLPLYYRLSIRAMKQNWRVIEIPTTELVKPTLADYRRIVSSIIPLLSTLVGEAFFRQK